MRKTLITIVEHLPRYAAVIAILFANGCLIADMSHKFGTIPESPIIDAPLVVSNLFTLNVLFTIGFFAGRDSRK